MYIHAYIYIYREKTVSVLVEPHTVALSAAIFRAHSIVNKLTKELTDALAKGVYVYSYIYTNLCMHFFYGYIYMYIYINIYICIYLYINTVYIYIGQPSLQGISSLLAFPIEITYDSVKYAFTAKTLGPNIYSLNINGQEVVARVREQPDASLLCSVGKDNYQLFGQDEALGIYCIVVFDIIYF
jgi:hypothetical protein